MSKWPASRPVHVQDFFGSLRGHGIGSTNKWHAVSNEHKQNGKSQNLSQMTPNHDCRSMVPFNLNFLICRDLSSRSQEEEEEEQSWKGGRGG